MSDNLPALVWDDSKFLFQKKLGNFVQFFQVNLPTNSYGIPTRMIDPLIIAENMFECENTNDMTDEAIEKATMLVEFDDNMPVVDGVPIWERFDGEQLDYYKLFKEYREMLYLSGSRAITRLAQMQNIPGRTLNTLSKVYHWAARCRAYDIFKKMEVDRKRQYEIEKLESKHSKAADILMEQAMTYLEKHPEQMNPKIAVQMLQMAMKAGRLALGLNPEKPGSTDGGSAPNINIQTNVGAPIEMTDDSGPATGGTPKAQDLSHLQSVLHILEKSGALAKANVVEADYSVVDED